MISLTRSYSSLFSSYQRRQTISDLTQQMNAAQHEVSTGMKSDVYKSLGMGAAETLSLRASMAREAAQIDANALLNNRLETTAGALGSIRDSVAEVLELGLANRSAPLGTAAGLQEAARAALESVIAQANGSHAGMPLFAGAEGTSRALQPWNTANPDTGLAPADVLAGILSGGLASGADASARVAEIAAVFDGTATDPATDFEATFYNGSTGATPRLQALVGDDTVLSYGVQANDDAFRDVIRGLSMLASTDAATISDPTAYDTWVGAAVDALSAGTQGLLSAETALGSQMALIEDANQRFADRIDLYNLRILDLEGVDEYEAATRLSNLGTQLQASYAVSAQLSQLSFLNFMP
ncbi:flagellin [Pseudooceanicola aestuarii]|uniref:flagellin n=1 Tax=Pseudooceanicola aestuarii TaxID=2697319 RepID=UPI0013D4733A|nr:flagellin [Pseudooceanicola aestuarii]